jgi:hypothetical protein
LLLRVDSIIEGELAEKNAGLWIMTGTSAREAEMGKDSSDGSAGG